VPDGFRFAARAVDECLRAHGAETLGFDLALSPSPAAPSGAKLGLGGSARAAVLASEAARYVLELRLDALKLALLAHAKAQQGVGSGADVAAVFAGGIIRYRRYFLEEYVAASNTSMLAAALASSPPVDLWRIPPARVQLAYAYTEQSASTPRMIAEVESRLGEEERESFVSESDSLGNALEEALVRGDFPTLRQIAAELQALLAGLGAVETENIRRLLALAGTHGCAGKISGAGGGDGCILFAPDAQARAAALEALSARGFRAFPVEVEPGLRGEVSPDPSLAEWLKAG
jgi:phosphomevalonate kinase